MPASRHAAASLVARLTAWCALAGAVALATQRSGLLGGSEVLWGRWVYLAVLSAATAAIALRAALVRTERRAWTYLALAATCWLGASAYWEAAIAPLADQPFPSLADAGWLAFYPLAYAGVVLLGRPLVPRFTSAVWLDACVGGLAVAALGAALVFGAIRAGTTGDTAAVVTNLAYPLADLLLVALVVGGFAAARWRVGRGALALGASLTVLAAADSIYVYRVATGTYGLNGGDAVDAMWPFGMALLALAAWRLPRRSRPPAEDGWAAPALTVVFTLLALGLLLHGALRPDAGFSPVAAILAALTIVAACVRTALAFREVSSLAGTRRQAVTDELTGLPNRRRTYARLEAALERDADVAFLLIDLDGFKEINDTLGHGAGDELLRRIGPRLGAGLGHDELLGRLGGDEFGVVLPRTDAARALDVAHAIRRRLEAPFDVQGLELVVDGSIGVATAPGTAEELVQRADVAMYRAKAARTGVEAYTADRDEHSRDRLTLLSDLRRALDDGGIVVHYQPQMHARTGAVRGVEALVRWEHPVHGLLTPAQFLPAAEQTGLMRPLTLEVLHQALAQTAAWRDEGHVLRMSVNLAVVNLLDRQLPADVAGLLRRHGVDPALLTVEVTENVVMADPDRAAVILGELRETGVGVALDDFGTGHSSLAWLKTLPVDELKIDRAFVKDILGDAAAAAIVRTTVDLARALDLRTVAEGAEDAATAERLAAFGCDLVQGYVLTPPLPADELMAWLASREMVAAAPRPARLSS